MKVFIKTLKGSTHFEIEATPNHTVADLKKNIENVRGCPAFQQMLLYQGKVLEDNTTLKDNNVAENGFIVLMLTKGRSSAGDGSTKSSNSLSNVQQSSLPPFTSEPLASGKLASPWDSVFHIPHSSVSSCKSPPAISPSSMVNVVSEAGVEDHLVYFHVSKQILSIASTISVTPSISSSHPAGSSSAKMRLDRVLNKLRRAPSIYRTCPIDDKTKILQNLDMRLDYVLYRMKFATTVPTARSLVSHQHVLVNGGVVDKPSYVCRPSDATSSGKQ